MFMKNKFMLNIWLEYQISEGNDLPHFDNPCCSCNRFIYKLLTLNFVHKFDVCFSEEGNDCNEN